MIHSAGLYVASEKIACKFSAHKLQYVVWQVRYEQNINLNIHYHILKEIIKSSR